MIFKFYLRLHSRVNYSLFAGKRCGKYVTVIIILILGNAAATFRNFESLKTTVNIGAILPPNSVEEVAFASALARASMESEKYNFVMKPVYAQFGDSFAASKAAVALSKAIALFIKDSDWNSYTLLYDDDLGLIRLQEILKLADPEVKWLVRRLIPGEDNRPLLKALKASGQMRVVIDCPADRILEYLRQANEVQFFEDFMTYVLMSLDAHTIDLGELRYGLSNVTCLRIFDHSDSRTKSYLADWKTRGGYSTRWVCGMWWFFALIMCSSYTANLAAFLTNAAMDDSIKSAEDLAMQTKIKYGTMFGGSTYSFFKSKRGYAYFMESTAIEYQLERHCDLMQVGGLLDSKGYGIALPFFASYRTAVDNAVLKLAESGKLVELKNRWWQVPKEDACVTAEADDGASAGELGVDNVGGVFVVLGIGCGLSAMSQSEAFWAELTFALSFWETEKPVKHSRPSTVASDSDKGSRASSVIRSAADLFHIELFK
ncbi:Glutamate receptor, ionotropic kainate 2 [Operophtera brumata]|uniref:Glutamate receptor, ionotropic kainate 2 n=1 Tax=Operophtera brumata TaxID=104452 RepID=A0A0L7LUJ9_OPEBR|nr:Glutamate receptor, ionotropic kainate 2 [Operophtera brumata]